MKIKIERSVWRRMGALAAVGAAAGFLNGFLGAGAGIILMYAFGALNRGEESARDNFAMTVATVLPLSMVSVAVYASKGAVSASAVGRYMVPAVVGGIIGGILTDKVNTKILRLVFAVVVIIAGINMLR